MMSTSGMCRREKKRGRVRSKCAEEEREGEEWRKVEERDANER